MTCQPEKQHAAVRERDTQDQSTEKWVAMGSGIYGVLEKPARSLGLCMDAVVVFSDIYCAERRLHRPSSYQYMSVPLVPVTPS